MPANANVASVLKVVVIEDDPAVLLFLVQAITRLGHKVLGEGSSGPEMVRLVRSLEPDIVVFDIHLPKIDGLEALRQIYQERVVAAVAITADRDQALVQRALEEHVLAFLLKPVEEHHLGPALLVAHARSLEMQQLSDENNSLKQNLASRKLIERAKGALMKRHRWTEQEAFRRLQRAAMNRRTNMAQLAQEVLNGVEMDL